jgi:hypothetical protein
MKRASGLAALLLPTCGSSAVDFTGGSGFRSHCRMRVERGVGRGGISGLFCLKQNLGLM